jgi:MoaA/NifB/PqqE/SkfB family radical SAM enzyme
MTDYKKHLKYRTNRSSYATASNPRLLGLTSVEINPTELCNRTCCFCPRSNPTIYPNRNLNMNLETAEILRIQLKNSLFDGDINITGFGEPLLNPNILEIIKIFSNDFFTEMVTNGDKIYKGNITIQDIEKTNLNFLIVDCYDNETQTNWFKENLQRSSINYAIRNHYHDDSVDKLIKKYGFNNRAGAVYTSNNDGNPCFFPSYKAIVDWNGDVRLCCNDWLRQQSSFGNIYTTDFSQIWHSAEFSSMRKDLINGKRTKFKSCKNCDVHGTKLGKSSADLWK